MRNDDGRVAYVNIAIYHLLLIGKNRRTYKCVSRYLLSIYLPIFVTLYYVPTYNKLGRSRQHLICQQPLIARERSFNSLIS